MFTTHNGGGTWDPQTSIRLHTIDCLSPKLMLLDVTALGKPEELGPFFTVFARVLAASDNRTICSPGAARSCTCHSEGFSGLNRSYSVSKFTNFTSIIVIFENIYIELEHSSAARWRSGYVGANF